MPSRREGRQILPLRAREIRGHVVRGVRCAGHGRSPQEARAGASELVPGVRTEKGGPKVEIDLEVTLGSCKPMTVGLRLQSVEVRTHVAAMGPEAGHCSVQMHKGVRKPAPLLFVST